MPATPKLAAPLRPVRPSRSRAAGSVQPLASGPRGFSLIELLVVIAVIALLVSLLIPALSHCRFLARQTRELAAAQQLMLAFAMYADASKGRVLVGYPSRQQVNGPMVVRNNEGERLTGELAQRYPWRLAPYLDHDFRGLYSDERLLNAIKNSRAEYEGYGINYDYVVSLFPSLGMNVAFVGGSDRHGMFEPTFQEQFGRPFVERIDQPARPTQLIVFASARDGLQPLFPQIGRPEGFFRIEPPYFSPGMGRRWDTAYDPNAPAPGNNSGFISLRNGGRAVAALFDGHGETLNWEQLADMRRWADEADSPDWELLAR